MLAVTGNSPGAERSGGFRSNMNAISASRGEPFQRASSAPVAYPAGRKLPNGWAAVFRAEASARVETSRNRRCTTPVCTSASFGLSFLLDSFLFGWVLRGRAAVTIAIWSFSDCRADDEFVLFPRFDALETRALSRQISICAPPVKVPS